MLVSEFLVCESGSDNTPWSYDNEMNPLNIICQCDQIYSIQKQILDSCIQSRCCELAELSLLQV